MHLLDCIGSWGKKRHEAGGKTVSRKERAKRRKEAGEKRKESRGEQSGDKG